MKSDTNTKEAFNERMITQELTQEFIEHGTKIEKEGEAIELISELVVWFENNHNAVAQAEKKEGYIGGYLIRVEVIPAINADNDVIKRGLEEFQHRLYKTYNQK